MKPREWSTQMLKGLIREYDRDPGRFSDPGRALDIWELAVKAGIFDKRAVSLHDFYSGNPFRDAVDTVVEEMRGRRWVDSGGTAGQTWIRPLLAGIDEGRRLMRPWYRKAWSLCKGDVRTVVVAVVISVITTVVTTWLLRVLGR